MWSLVVASLPLRSLLRPVSADSIDLGLVMGVIRARAEGRADSPPASASPFLGAPLIASPAPSPHPSRTSVNHTVGSVVMERNTASRYCGELVLQKTVSTSRLPQLAESHRRLPTGDGVRHRAPERAPSGCLRAGYQPGAEDGVVS